MSPRRRALTVERLDLDEGAAVARPRNVAAIDEGDAPALSRQAAGAAGMVRVGEAREGTHAGERAEEVGRCQGGALVHHGPFVAGSRDEIVHLFDAYRRGGFPGLSALSPEALA